MKAKIVLIAAFLSLLVLAPVARAQDKDSGQSAATPSAESQPGIPPKLEALRHARIAACAKKAAGDPCSFSRGTATVQGKCAQTRRGLLVCTGHPSGAAASKTPK